MSYSDTAAASAVCIYYVIIGGALRAPLYVHDKIHTGAAEAAAEAAEAASKSVLALNSFIYEKLSNELPIYQVLPNELPSRGNSFY